MTSSRVYLSPFHHQIRSQEDQFMSTSNYNNNNKASALNRRTTLTTKSSSTSSSTTALYDTTSEPFLSISSTGKVTKHKKQETTTTSSSSYKSLSALTTFPSPSPIRIPSPNDMNHLPSVKPKLLVFDLDNTLWTPELYQIRQHHCPMAGQQIHIFPGMMTILEHIHADRTNNGGGGEWSNTKLAIASRTSKGHWAYTLLDTFTLNSNPSVSLSDLFDYVEIQTGTKKVHFERLRKVSGGIPYDEMLFVDDDINMNCKEIASQLGVLTCHCPNGLVTTELFTGALDRYAQLKEEDESSWMGYIVNSVNLGLEAPKEGVVDEGRITTGTIKMYNPLKRFGFVVEDDDDASKKKKKKEFFFHESKVADGLTIQKGMKVELETMVDKQGRPAATILGQVGSDGSSSMANDDDSTTKVTMKCFSMSQPYASLLLYGIKTVESRNNDMFVNLPPGTQVLLACGRRDWHDPDAAWIELEETGDYTEDEIQKWTSLPREYRRGDIIGLLTIGETWRSTARERKSSTKLQRQVVSAYEGIGEYCTRITEAKWLQKPIAQSRGKPGIYDVQVLPSDLETK